VYCGLRNVGILGGIRLWISLNRCATVFMLFHRHLNHLSEEFVRDRLYQSPYFLT